MLSEQHYRVHGHQMVVHTFASPPRESLRQTLSTAVSPVLEPETAAAAWELWNLPTVMADPSTARLCTMEPVKVVELLLQRFYTGLSFNAIVVPHWSLTLHRLRFRRPSPVPSYLLHTMAACAAASGQTKEAELVLWRAQAWHGATEAVHNRLNRSGLPELELIQALLLLAANWSGHLLRVERINTFDTAISLATSLQLHSGRHLNESPGPKSSRVVLFWCLFCADKVFAIMLKRVCSIPTESHSIPLPAIGDVEAAYGLSGKLTVAAVLQRLVHALIQLSQLAEHIQRDLLLPVHFRRVTTLEQILQRTQPFEKQLDRFYREQQWLLGSASTSAVLCRGLAEAVVLLFHFNRLHLHLPALKCEVDFRTGRRLRSTNQNRRPLTDSIESAWRLLRQPLESGSHSQSRIYQFAQALSPADAANAASGPEMDTCMLSFSKACVIIAINFFKFLATHWVEWDDGKGCTKYSAIEMKALKPLAVQTRSGDLASSLRAPGSSASHSCSLVPQSVSSPIGSATYGSVAQRRRSSRNGVAPAHWKRSLAPMQIQRLKSESGERNMRKEALLKIHAHPLPLSPSSASLEKQTGEMLEGLDKAVQRRILGPTSDQKRCDTVDGH